MSGNASQPVRLLHLPGGLRLLDMRTDKIAIQLNAKKIYATIQTPDYPQVYNTVADIGLPAIGVEFPTHATLQGVHAPDWQPFFPSQGFAILNERDAWSQVKTLAQRERREGDADLAKRMATYLDLAAFRLFDLSNSYGRVLTTFDHDRDARQKIGHMFANSFGTALEAAIHAFAADAASLRDLIVEAAWTLLGLGGSPAPKIRGFLKQYRLGTHPLGDEIKSVAGSGGWLAQLSDLRNDITHAAPIGGRGMRHCTVRAHRIGSGIVPRLHYPLFGSNGNLYYEDLDTDFSDDESARLAIGLYKVWSNNSIDALEFAWITTGHLVSLLSRIRVASGIRGERLTLTDKDIIGPVVVKRFE
jgi:hypothetical protein